MIDQDLPVAVIGVGPVGLAAAAHLLARGERSGWFCKHFVYG
jgi:cation diffusion facilitator CzcD-associated flavoprotein CzcO